MINLFKKVGIGLCCVIMMQSCGGDSNTEEPEVLQYPVLQSSDPTNNETGVDTKISTMVLNFEDDITVVAVARIKVNGTQVSSATASGNVLTITLPALSYSTNYTLILEKMAIKVVNGGVNTEAISISITTSESPDITIASSPVVANASTQTVNVYNYLKDNYGTKILSSTMSNVAWNINEAEWVKQHTGKYPAITTFDYIQLDYAPANWIDYSDISALKDWWNNNGLISAGWHWRVPTSEGSATNSYDPSNFNAADATVEGTWENTVVKADLAEMAGYLKLLKDQNIPVIWRPLHEAAGNTYEYTNGKAWFWWGYDGAEAYKKLWIYMFDYFESQGLNNLIWVWTTQTGDNAFYPGDDYVDIVGRDIYNNSTASTIAAEFTEIQETYPNKMVTLSECGNVAKISAQWGAEAKWSFFMPWYDNDRTKDVNSAAFASTDHGHANAAWWVDAFAQDCVITLDEMPNLK